MKLLRRRGVAIQRNSYTLTTVTLLIALFITGCVKSDVPAAPENVVFTLYTHPVSDPYFRIHIATFDSYVDYKGSAEAYVIRNKKYCDEAAVSFQSNFLETTKGIANADRVRYWCEKGRFKK